MHFAYMLTRKCIVTSPIIFTFNFQTLQLNGIERYNLASLKNFYKCTQEIECEYEALVSEIEFVHSSVF